MVILNIHMHKSVLSTNNMFLMNVFASCQGNLKPPTFMQATILEVRSPPSTTATALWL